VYLVIPGTFGFLVWRSYRRDRRSKGEGGEGFSPRGKQRW
jgi:hypothetical protein